MQNLLALNGLHVTLTSSEGDTLIYELCMFVYTLLIYFLCLCKGLIIYLVLGLVLLLTVGPEDFRFYGYSLQGLMS